MAALLACASARECEGVRRECHVLGVGKVAAAVSMANLLREQRPTYVLLFGVAGAFPPDPKITGDGGHRSELGVGDLCVVTSEVLADEGVASETGFSSIAQMGLGDCGPWRADAELSRSICRRLRVAKVAGATVSTCSATDAASMAVARRTKAQVETMEGAAVALACARAGVPWVQLRCISNRTGDRERSGWDLPLAVERVQEAVEKILGGDEGSSRP